MKCIGCKYADWKRTKNGRLHPSGEGRCRYEMKVPQLPNAFFWMHLSSPELDGGRISRKQTYDTHCPYYVPEGGHENQNDPD